MRPEHFIHPEFRLNGLAQSVHALQVIAYSYIKEGTAWEQQIGNFLLDWLDDKDTVTLHTSGSTGTAKSYKFPKTMLIASAQATQIALETQPGMRVLMKLPGQYIAGKMMIVRALQGGHHLTVDKPQVVWEFEGHYDHTSMTAQQLYVNAHQLDRFGSILVGGGAVQLERLGTLPSSTRIIETYGMTETVSHVALRELHPTQAKYFTPIDGVQVVESQEGTAQIFAPHLEIESLQTTDAVTVNQNGTFQVLGRVDDVINTGGIKVSPTQVERKLATAIDVPFVISARPHEVLGQEVVLVIEQASSAASSVLQLEALAQLCSKYERPRAIVTVPCLPLTRTGKLNRRALQEQLAAG